MSHLRATIARLSPDGIKKKEKKQQSTE